MLSNFIAIMNVKVTLQLIKYKKQYTERKGNNTQKERRTTLVTHKVKR